MTPTEVQAGVIRDLEARLQLANERLFYISAELAAARGALVAIDSMSRHCIPHYAYGDNEAACEMADRLNQICTTANQALSPHERPTDHR